MSTTSEWRGALGAKWAENSRMMDDLLRPFGAAAIDGLGDIGGLSVLDLGCGDGEASFMLAERTGPRGVVVGLDISPDLIALAAAERERRGAANVGFLCADAATARLGRSMDALHSRFGSMFFDRPADAWARLRANMAPGAKLSAVCWRGLKENAWAFAPLAAATPHLPAFDAPPPGAPGPFAWAKPEASFLPALEGAGWRDVAHERIDADLAVGAAVEGIADPVEAAVEFAFRIGPTASRVKSADAAQASRARAAVREDMAARLKDGAVSLSGACWLVTARA